MPEEIGPSHSDVGLCDLSDADVERLIGQLRAIAHKSAWERVLEVGQLVFEGIAAGNEAEWRCHRSRKNISLRKLVEHPACPFKKSALSNAVNVHLFVKANPGVPSMKGVTPTHVGHVAVFDHDTARSLLESVSTLGWSGRDLYRHTRALRKKAGERRGRPPSSSAHRVEVAAHCALRALLRMQSELESCDAMEPQSQGVVLQTVDEISALVANIRSLASPAPRKSGFVLPLHHRQDDASGKVAAG